MPGLDYAQIVARHRNYFLSGATRPVEWREQQLTALQRMMTERADEFYDAMWRDLHRNRVDADLTDVKYVADEAGYALAHLRKWAANTTETTAFSPPSRDPTRPLCRSLDRR